MVNPLELARGLEPELIAWRRELHQQPEVAWEEARTSQLVAERCEALGLRVRRPAARMGVVAELHPDLPPPALALRADLDALPLQEENEIPYRSAVPGKGHLCGHDAHTAILLGAAKLLSQLKDQLPFRIRFLFQPAEEVVQGGAEAFLAEGLLEGVDEVFGLHVNPLVRTGQLALRAGPAMGSMDRFEVLLGGEGGHAASPHLCKDPVVAAAELILALQTLVSRRLNPLDPAVVSVCQVQAGAAFNVLPGECLLAGTARSLTPAVRRTLETGIAELAEGVAKAHGLTVQAKYVHGTPVLVNSAASVQKMRQAFQALGGTDCELPVTLGGEDFAYYLERTPGCLGFLGAGDGTERTRNFFHHPRFDIDEQALAWGTALFVQLALERARGTAG